MAKLEYELSGDFDAILRDIEDAVLSGSLSATEEDRSDLSLGDVRCAVRVYERYSMFGGNRVSMNVTLIKAHERIFASAITSGGSQAVLFKVNTVGEETFLDTVANALSAHAR